MSIFVTLFHQGCTIKLAAVLGRVLVPPCLVFTVSGGVDSTVWMSAKLGSGLVAKINIALLLGLGMLGELDDSHVKKSA